MARAALNITILALSEVAKVAPNTISRFEAGKTAPIPATVAVLQSALEAAGVIFLADGDTTSGGPGVRLREEKLD